MEQIWLVITGNPAVVLMGCCVLTMILPAVTLHRIRRYERQMKKLTELATRTLMQAEYLSGMVQGGANDIMKAQIMEELAKHQSEEQPQEEQPEELLNAVLGEVF